MLELLGFKTDPMFVPVDDDDTVRPVNEKLATAIANLTRDEQRERRLIEVLLGRVGDATQAEHDEAERALEIRKGGSGNFPQSWYLPVAEAGRKAVKQLRAELAVARDAAQAKLEALGREQLRPVIERLCRDLGPAQATLLEYERLRLALGQAGAKTLPCPVPMLLPNGLIQWQLDLACQMVGATRPT